MKKSNKTFLVFWANTRETRKNFSFKAAGFRFECKFPSKGWQQTRQDILIRSKVGDAINLRQYEWEGEPAFALISDRWRADVELFQLNT